jgi:hypothetical protein
MKRITICAAAIALLATGSVRAETPYPDVVDISHATPEAAAFFKSYFTAKSEHKQCEVAGDTKIISWRVLGSLRRGPLGTMRKVLVDADGDQRSECALSWKAK